MSVEVCCSHEVMEELAAVHLLFIELSSGASWDVAGGDESPDKEYCDMTLHHQLRRSLLGGPVVSDQVVEGHDVLGGDLHPGLPHASLLVVGHELVLVVEVVG